MRDTGPVSMSPPTACWVTSLHSAARLGWGQTPTALQGRPHEKCGNDAASSLPLRGGGCCLSSTCPRIHLHLCTLLRPTR